MENIHPFVVVAVFFAGGLLVVAGGLFVSRLLRPSNPGEEKLSAYECGEEPVGNAWGRFNVRYYIVALAFVLFEVEMVLLLPFALSFSDQGLIAGSGGLWGWVALTEVFIFVGMLILGLAYLWRQGLLNWGTDGQTRQPVGPNFINPLYERFNQKY